MFEGFGCLSVSHLKDGVLLFRHRHVACSVFPGDLEEAVVWTEPLKTRIPAAVHLSQQPGLQTDPPRLDAHGGGTGRRLGGDWEETGRTQSKSWAVCGSRLSVMSLSSARPFPRSCPAC